MFSRNLTAKILVAVGITVALVIAIYTYFVIRVQSVWWHERTAAQNVIAAAMVHEYLSGVMLSARHEEMQKFLLEVKSSQEIHRGRIVATDGRVMFSTETQEVGQVVMTLPENLFAENRVLQGERNDGGAAVSVVMRPVINGASCRTCHQDGQAYRGAVVLERSLAPAEASIAANRNLLVFYGVVIFVLVGVVIWLLVLRLVTQPVSNVLRQMQRVQQGDLAARAPADSHDEIGELAIGFNSMVASLDQAQQQLRESHEKQIQQAGKLASIGELAAGIAHEIRNPLAGIGAAVEILAEVPESNGNGNGSGERHEIVGEIHRQIKRLNTTLHDLLGFARQREPEVVPCDVCDLIKPMLALVRPEAQKQRVEIVEAYAAGLPLVTVDPQQIQQALLNLFLNGVQAMPNGGRLTVTAAAAGATDGSVAAWQDGRMKTEKIDRAGNGDWSQPGSLPTFHSSVLPVASVTIAITDTGCGIAADTMQKIFSPFFTTKHRGTGLGLAIVRSIVEKHQGTIGVNSQVNRGSTFTLKFAACQLEEKHLTYGTN